MKITLRQSEVNALLYALELAYNGEFGPKDSMNAQYLRLIKKLGGTV